MELLICSWVTQDNDQGDTKQDEGFEGLLAQLYRNDFSRDVLRALKHLHGIEGKLLFGKTAVSPRQVARYWYRAAACYTKFEKYSAAFEAYELCLQAVEDEENATLLAIHARWGPIAALLGHHEQAWYSHTLVMRLIRQLEQESPGSIHAHEDNPLFLAAVAYRSQQLASV